jgi:hypothetical protein
LVTPNVAPKKMPAAMNITHLADALDCWKGWLITRALPELRDLRVLPMLTDAQAWTDDHHALYAKMMAVPASSILLRNVAFTHAARAEYFAQPELTASLGTDADLFVDPDTGIWRDRKWIKVANRDRSVRTSELASLLPAGSDRVVLVYRHGRERMPRFSEHLQAYAREAAGACVLGVRGGGVTAAFFSQSRQRLDRVRSALVREFFPCDDQRVTALLP